MTQRIAINRQHGGFGLSRAAYEKLIEWGVPVRKYVEQERDPKTGLVLPQPANDGEVIFDNRETGEGTLLGPYWDCWTRENRTHPLVLRVINELGEEANGDHASLRVVEIPDGVEWEIEEYDGLEWVAEKHRTWR